MTVIETLQQVKLHGLDWMSSRWLAGNPEFTLALRMADQYISEVCGHSIDDNRRVGWEELQRGLDRIGFAEGIDRAIYLAQQEVL